MGSQILLSSALALCIMLYCCFDNSSSFCTPEQATEIHLFKPVGFRALGSRDPFGEGLGLSVTWWCGQTTLPQTWFAAPWVGLFWFVYFWMFAFAFSLRAFPITSCVILKVSFSCGFFLIFTSLLWFFSTYGPDWDHLCFLSGVWVFCFLLMFGFLLLPFWIFCCFLQHILWNYRFISIHSVYPSVPAAGSTQEPWESEWFVPIIVRLSSGSKNHVGGSDECVSPVSKCALDKLYCRKLFVANYLEDFECQ